MPLAALATEAARAKARAAGKEPAVHTAFYTISPALHDVLREQGLGFIVDALPYRFTRKGGFHLELLGRVLGQAEAGDAQQVGNACQNNKGFPAITCKAPFCTAEVRACSCILPPHAAAPSNMLQHPQTVH